MTQQAQPVEAVASSPSSLSASVVSKQFGAVVALNQVSLELRPGEIHGLIGPNGSGKTTLLNLLSGYYQPTSGAIQLRGEELAQASVRRRAQLVSRAPSKSRACSAR
jgi:ABC-type branched-subunit amino acid transport system ATPase component